MKKTNSKSRDKKGADRKSLPFNAKKDKPKTEEKTNKTQEISKKALHLKSKTENPLSAAKHEKLVEEENGVGDAKRKGILKEKLKTKK